MQVNYQPEPNPQSIINVPKYPPIEGQINKDPVINEQIGDSQMTDEMGAYPSLENPDLSKKKSFDPDKINSQDLIDQ